MRINAVHTIASLARSAGGPTYSVTRLCDGLAGLGASVKLVTQRSRADGGGDILPAASAVEVHVTGDMLFARQQFAYSRSFRRTLTRCCSDALTIIHDHGAWLPTNLAASSVARSLHLPLVVSPRGTLEPWALSQSMFRKRLAWIAFEKRILRSAALLCVTSEQEGRNLHSLGLRVPLAVIPNGIDMPRGQGPSFLEAPRTILFLSRIHPKKGLLNLVEAWRRLRPAGWTVVIAGPDEQGHRAEVERAVATAGLQEEIRFIGPVFGEAKHGLFRTASLLVLPTRREQSGVVVLEALSHGLPVITTKAAPWAELETHRCGWWVDVGAAPLEQALRLATSTSPNELREMGSRGKALAGGKYDWDGIAAKMLETYEWVLGRRGAPSFVYA